MELEPMVQCPFDPSHKIIKTRLPYHITICSKNHKKDGKKRCEFNSSHIIDACEYKQHLLECPSRPVDSMVYRNEIESHPSSILPVEKNHCTNQTGGWDDGDWGKIEEFHAYNPLESIQNRAISQPIIGLSKAQRKRHKQQERKRFNAINNKQ